MTRRSFCETIAQLNKESEMSKIERVGEVGENSQGLKWVITRYAHNKDLDIQFEDGEAVNKISYMVLKAGNPQHPTYGKPKAGDTFECKDGDTVVILEYKSPTHVLCKWMSDGEEAITSIGRLRGGVNKHPTRGLVKVGDVYKTTRHGDVEVVRFESVGRCVVKFKDGVEGTFGSEYVKKGNIKHPNLHKDRIGFEFKTNSGWGGKVIGQVKNTTYLVEWQDGSTSEENWGDCLSGSIKPAYQPSFAGIGYLGSGKYVSTNRTLKDGEEYVPEVILGYWSRMISRCYDPNELRKPSGYQYRDTTVHEDWLNLQNFIEWSKDKIGMGVVEESTCKVFHLDKDILNPKNKVYSPDNCVFVPNAINSFFKVIDNSLGYYGASEIDVTNKSPNAKIGYTTRSTNPVTNERVYGGFFPTPKLAEDKFFEMKNEYAKLLADKWDGKVDPRVINILRTRDMREYYDFD